MSGLVAIGLVGSILAVVAYVIAACVRRKKPELCDAMSVFLSSVSFMAAVRLIGCAFSPYFAKVIAAQADNDAFWKLTSDDLPLIILAGIALGWVSIQVTLECFAKLGKVSGNGAAEDREVDREPPAPPLPKGTGTA